MTDRFAIMLTTQVPIPEQPSPNQPAKFALASGEALKVAEVPSLKLAEQNELQLIPWG